MELMEYADFVEKCIKEYKETENEFVYQFIAPFCGTVVEKKLSKKELKEILLKGMQKSIPLDKIEQAIEEMHDSRFHGKTVLTYNDAINDCVKILDKLIAESEGVNEQIQKNTLS